MEFIYLPNDSQQVKRESLQNHSLYIPLIIVSHHPGMFGVKWN